MVHRQPEAPNLFGQSRDEISGFSYHPDLFSERDELSFVSQFETLVLRPFDFHGFKGNRRVISFGWRYDYGASKLEETEPLPSFLQPLSTAAARLSRIPETEFKTALVTEYTLGAGIGWHRDKPMFRDVMAFSFLAPCRLRLRRRENTSWRRVSSNIAPRSAYFLQGEARELWEHSIPPVTALRYSVTFRTFKLGHDKTPIDLRE
jgi:alkylated DNA repair dioxygenase AlkB